MSEWHGEGTPRFRWQSGTYGDRSQVQVDRRNWATVSLSVGAGDVYIGHELTPAMARELAAALIDGADQVELDPLSAALDGGNTK